MLVIMFFESIDLVLEYINCLLDLCGILLLFVDRIYFCEFDEDLLQVIWEVFDEMMVLLIFCEVFYDSDSYDGFFCDDLFLWNI